MFGEKGLETARRVKELTEEVHIDVKDIYLVGNRFPPEMEELLEKSADEIGMEHGGLIPVDQNVMTFNMTGKPLLELPEDSPANVAVDAIARRIGLDML